MATDGIIPLIDLSDFLSDLSEKKAVEGIQGHMQKLVQQFQSCNKIEKVKLLLPRYDGVGGYSNEVKVSVAALDTLHPGPGEERTIQRVEFRFNCFNIVTELIATSTGEIFDESSDRSQERGSLTVNCLYLYKACECTQILKYQEHFGHSIQEFRTQSAAIMTLIKKKDITVQHTVLVWMHKCDLPSDDECNVFLPEITEISHKHILEYDDIECHAAFVTPKQEHCNISIAKFFDSKSLQHLNLEQIHAKSMSRGGGVAVALLSSGYNYFDQKKNFVGEYNFITPFSPVHESRGIGPFLTEIVSQVAPDAKLIPCKTTSGWPQCTSPCGVTSRALNQLREKWKAREWREDVHSLVVLIPYGGYYREDEMRAINAAIDDGIIVVCAAGDTTPQTSGKHVPGIAFPASMGNVLCVGAVDENNEPTVVSPSGREVDCMLPGTYCRESGYVFSPTFDTRVGTGISAAILSGLIAIILSFIESSLNKPPGTCPCPEYNHVSIIREVLQQTTTSAKHHPHSGYGLFTSRLFSFSEHQLKKLLNSITQERIFRTIPGSASEMTEQCKFNSEILCNDELNSELQLPVTLDGGGIRVAVIDDDFPQILKTKYVADELQTEMHSWDECTPSLSENAELLNRSIKSLNELACSLRKKIPYVEQGALQLEEKAKSIESQIESMTEEVCLNFTSVKDSHGLQCVLVVANTTPKADLFLVNSGFDSTSLATMIENLVERRKRPDVIVCSLGFDQFNLRLSKAVNKAINAGIIPVFSAGNIGLTGSNTISYPSRLGNGLCIGAHTWHGTSHSFSSVGREVDFLAPGEFMILGKYPVSGTSFAAPAVAAFIALILQYVDKIVSGEWKQRPLEDKYKLIDAWSEEEPGSDRWSWNKIPLNVACRNVYVMRELLRQMSVHRTEHLDSAGYGNLDIRRLLKDLEPEDIHSIVQNFHQPPP